MLSGEVKIREQSVVKWEAECLAPTEGWPGRWNYRVIATGIHSGRNFRREFVTPHERNAGPMVLTANIMTDLVVMLNEQETM